MPLLIDSDQVPDRWVQRVARALIPNDRYFGYTHGLQIAFINNMPDPALEDTELQFFELLDAASGDFPIYLKLYSLTGIPRTDRGTRHLNRFYLPFEDLWQHRFDGVIITGTEPKHPELRQEPYWGLLTRVFDWAQRSTTSTVLSCLAVHASVLHCDGIKRYPLPDKKFGVFEAVKNSDHVLIDGSENRLCFPHSRWNEVKKEELIAAGYQVLADSAGAGVDLFVKQMQSSLFIHFQGHPEYWAETLAKEYKRDIKRFLRGERQTYPTMPQGYFPAWAIDLLKQFHERARLERCDATMEYFPEPALEGLQRTWESSSRNIYHNWISWMIARKTASRVTQRTSARSANILVKGIA